jgi:protein-S-isoprenylcysteine O-methyltransferase Ste14
LSTDPLFKVVFLAAFLVAAWSATSATRRAAARHGAPTNQLQNEVRGLLVVRAVLGLVFYVALGGWLFDWRREITDLHLPLFVRYFGIALLAIGVLLIDWGYRSLGTNYRGGIGLYDQHELVTDGAYRWLRHPIYAGFMVIMCAVTLVSSDWLLGLSGLLLVMSIPAGRLRQEESQLRDRFTGRWDAYRDRTGAFVPRYRSVRR